MARPSKYDPDKDYGKLVDEYLVTCGREQTKLPKLSEFAREYVLVDRDTVTDWGKKHKKFLRTIKRISYAQKEQLMDDGLYGGKEVNQAMAIFLLKANHNMIETQRTEVTGRDGENLGVVILPLKDDNNMASTSGTTDSSPT